MLEEPKIKKVDKRDKQLPQNFEQLIEMYDVEKIWPFILKTIQFINKEIPEDFKELIEKYELEDILEFFNSASKIMDFNASGKGLAIGKVSEKDAFEVDLPIECNRFICIGEKEGAEAEFTALQKTRTIDGIEYMMTVGLGLNKSAAIEIIDENRNVVGRLEVHQDGTIKNWITGKQLLEFPEIIENSNGMAIKYPDGRMICSGTFHSSGINTEAWGNSYAARIENPVTFPANFTKTYSVNVNCVDNTHAFWVHRVVFDTTKITAIEISRPSAVSNGGAYFSYTAIGKWK